MKVRGFEVPVEIKAAALARMERGPFVVAEIVPLVRKMLPPDLRADCTVFRLSHSEIADRIVDRILQGEKKAGRVEKTGLYRTGSPIWRWVSE